MHPEFVSGFSYSLLKNRLLMMTKPVNSRRSGFRILAAAPVAAGLMLLFSFTEKAPESAEIDTKDTINEAVAKIQQPPVDDVFMRVENMPTFEGGNEGTFRNWVTAQLKYPKEAFEKGIQGRVIVSFIVEKDGTLSTIEADKSPDASLSAEAIRVVRTSPKWTPGTQRGQVVRVKFTLPIDFSLQTSGTTKMFADTVKIVMKSASDAKVTIRRSGEQGGPDPLIVLDGEKMPANFNPGVIDPKAIQNVIVLKGESATQAYGEEGKNGVMIITTKENVETQQEVTVIGYGVQRKDDTDITMMSDGIIRIRGRAESNGAQPLIILDGKKLSADFDIKSIDPQTIESLEVLKEEAAAGIYGEEAKNGVILISTKK